MKIQFEHFEEDNTQTLNLCVRDDDSMYLHINNYIINGESSGIDKSAWYELTPKQLSQLIGSLLHLQSKIKTHKKPLKLS